MLSGTQRTPLPLLRDAAHGSSSRARPRSRRGRWRAVVLLSVYLLIAAHYLHWKLAGRTVTPVEPSEAMQTLERGLVNAGFVFFGLALLSTLVLGRWFCGWACHMVALQDLCTWLLRKVGLRPRPFRSRLLVYVPLAAGLYMFVWPSVLRIWLEQPHPQWQSHFTTSEFWATFPGLGMTLLTFAVCGFLMVYLLGNKGFCTYACPYGGLFGVLDRVAPGRIRVTDACQGCGHCTAVCTSNVRVHEEVRRHGMVVNPGCMKCTDCVSACPTGALYFGFGLPATLSRTRAPGPSRRYDYSWPEELALAAVFLGALYALRGLYDAVPFLLALGASAIIAFVVLEASRLARRRDRQLHGLVLRRSGRLRPAGWGLATGAAALLTFLVHSACVQFHEHRAQAALDAAAMPGQAPADVERRTRAAIADLEWLHRNQLITTARTEARLGSAWLYLGDLETAARHLQRALELRPGYGAARYKWGELCARRGDLPGAINELLRAVEDDPAQADARSDLIAGAARLGRLAEVRAVFERRLEREPGDAAVRSDLARVQAIVGER
jgi:tetratricopeptide (TPR) repeat protein